MSSNANHQGTKSTKLHKEIQNSFSLVLLGVLGALVVKLLAFSIVLHREITS